MTHLNAYTYTQIKELDPNKPLELKLTWTQQAEIAHHINNPLTIALFALRQLKDTDADPKAVAMLESSLKRIREYTQTITHQKAAS